MNWFYMSFIGNDGFWLCSAYVQADDSDAALTVCLQGGIVQPEEYIEVVSFWVPDSLMAENVLSEKRNKRLSRSDVGEDAVQMSSAEMTQKLNESIQ